MYNITEISESTQCFQPIQNFHTLTLLKKNMLYILNDGSTSGCRKMQ